MPASQNTEVTESKTGIAKRALPIFVLMLIAVFIISMGWHRYLTLESLANSRETLKNFIDSNFVLALLIYMGLYIGVVAAMFVPGGAVLTITGGFLFGWELATPATVLAATIGATIVFFAASLLGDLLAGLAGSRLNALRQGFQKDALSYMFFLRLVPIFPFWLVNLAPGLLGVRLKTYLTGTFFGIIPGTAAYSFVGAGLDSVIAAQQETYQDCLARNAGNTEICKFSLDAGALITPEILIAFAALGVVALIPVVLKRVYRKETS